MQNKQEKAWAAVIAELKKRIENGQRGEVTSLANLLGTTRGTVSRWVSGALKGERKPYDEIVRIMSQLGLNPEIFFSDENTANKPKQIPLKGLAACGYEYWFKELKLPISVVVAPPGEYGENMFAVLTSGDSLKPFGIREGIIVYCDPDLKPEIDDIVLLERQNGTMTLKLFRGYDGADVLLEGWTPEDHNGSQEIHTLRVSQDNVGHISPVVFTKIK